MITISKKSLKCGFGNRLFHYNFISQIACQLNIDACVPSLMDDKILILKHASFKKKCLSVFKYNLVVSKENYHLLTPQKRLEFVVENKDENIKFDGFYLGEFFFDHLYHDPKDLISLNNGARIERQKDKVEVGIHFRGGDFHSWNPNAILDAQFYIDAIEFISSKYNDLEFYLITDDRSLGSFIKVKSFMELNQYSFIETRGSDFEDFSILSDCEYVIASPSTFCIWASILGKRKLLLSKKWVDYSIERNDAFWVDLVSEKNKIIDIVKIL